MGRNSAKEENLISRLGGIRNAVDETKALREKLGRVLGALRAWDEADRAFAAVDAEMHEAEEAVCGGFRADDALTEEHDEAARKLRHAKATARTLIAEFEKKEKGR